MGSGLAFGFGAPWAGAVAALLAAGWLVWRLPRLLPRAPAPRRRLARGASALALAATALALGDPWVGRPVDRLTAIAVVDRSRSVEGAAPTPEAVAARAAARMRPDDRLGVVAFARDAATVAPPSPAPVAVLDAPLVRDGTDLEAALRAALAELPPDEPGRILLVTDGRPTQGDVRRATALAAARGVPIDVLPVAEAPRREAAVARVDASPAAAPPGAPVELRVVTRATAPTEAVLRVDRDGVAVARAPVTLREGLDVFRVRDVVPAAAPALLRYDAVLEPLAAGEAATALGAAEDDAAAALLRVVGPRRALVIAGDAAAGQVVAEAWRAAGFEVPPPVGTPPAEVVALAGFDLIGLVDVEARAFTQEGLEALATATRDLGVGLFMAGARRSFGLGGYAGTPVEAVLPARFDLRRRRDRASLAMVFAIDVSGSMSAPAFPGSTVRKIDLANEAAARSAALLSGSDRVGVVHVDTDPHWTAPLAPVDDPGRVERAIRSADAGGGGIFVDVALEASYDALEPERTQLRHLLLFSDGDDSEQIAGARARVRAAARARVTTSVVSMGTGVDTPELEALSREGGGRFYVVDDLAELPRVFTQETVAAARAALVEAPVRAAPRASAAVIDGIDWAGAPALDGYAIVEAAPRAEVLLTARGADRDVDDPLLVRWQVGTGRSGLLATGAGVDLGAPWAGWPGLASLLGNVARDLARPRPDAGARLEATRDEGGGGRLVLEGPPDLAEAAATVVGPRGLREEVVLRAVARGRLEAAFDAGAPGPYLVTSPAAGGAVATLVVAPGQELAGWGADPAALARLAAATGGVVRGDAAGLFAARPPPVPAPVALWPALLAAALVALLVSVGARRVAFGGAARPARAPARPDGLRAPAAAATGPTAPRPEPASDRAASAAGEPHLSPAPPPGGAAPPATLAERLLADKRRRAARGRDQSG